MYYVEKQNALNVIIICIHLRGISIGYCNFRMSTTELIPGRHLIYISGKHYILIQVVLLLSIVTSIISRNTHNLYSFLRLLLGCAVKMPPLALTARITFTDKAAIC